MKKLVTCESVRAGHPDKVCDYISDSILDACLTEDKNAHVAAETLATVGKVITAGEVKCSKKINYIVIAGKAMEELGYDPIDFSFESYIHNQSVDIDNAVINSCDKKEKSGAGDQGTMYGYATSESSSMLPLPLEFSHKICAKLDECFRNKTITGIGPDGKAQVTIEYLDDGVHHRADSIIISCQHSADKNADELKKEIKEKVIDVVFPQNYIDDETKIFINPSGNFVIGGPEGDTGLTGRKIMVDTYGGVGPHGGGAFSGKDPSKVDRSAAYMARYLAKRLVRKGYCDRCQVAISYAIGKAEPTAVNVYCYDTEKVSMDVIYKDINAFDLTPDGIIEFLHLKEPIYKKTSAYGHFTDQSLPWEQDLKAPFEN